LVRAFHLKNLAGKEVRQEEGLVEEKGIMK
jgi:hypothetical protein